MWESVISIIIKYWVEFLLGIIVAGGGLFFRRYHELSKAERDQKRQDSQEKLKEAIKEDNQRMINEVSALSNQGDEKLQRQINTLNQEISTVNQEMSVIKMGVSSVQRKDFLEQCRYLLDPNHNVTLDEWDAISEDHDVYNALGGNHTGDQYYELIKKKVETTLGIKIPDKE